jgi:hypothetical protein
MKLICVGDEPGFTIGKEYEFEWIGSDPKIHRTWSTFCPLRQILIKNDFGDLIKHKLNEFIITMLPPSNIWVEYVDDSKDGLTHGKYYNLLDRNKASRGDEHYYFLDDNNKFVGAWRGNRFRDVSKIKLREDRLNELGI